MVKLTFLGGARTVTGSSFLLETDNLKLMIDCGLFQGNRELRMRNYRNPLVDPKSVDYILLTHAHIDHSGLIPRFCKQGFRGQVVATRATADLCQVMLPDSGHIQEVEAEWKSRKARRRGDRPTQPLYTAQDALESLQFFQPVDYNQEVTIRDQVRFRFRDAGHILGSALIEMQVKDGDGELKLVFSGDLGQVGTPIIKDPELVSEADYVLIESTYGNRLHQPLGDQAAQLKRIITETMARQGNVVIPAFAVGRTQDILYTLNQMVEGHEIGPIPVYIDSPLAVSATEIFERNRDCFDAETAQLIAGGDDPFQFPGLHLVRTTQESMALNHLPGGKVIISASGMCDAGRIKHHLKHNLWRPESSVVFVGYQAEGTLGRRILDGEKKVKILGEIINVAAQIHSLEGFSAHADQKGLIDWLSHLNNQPKQVFVVHGEETAASTLAELIGRELGLNAIIPRAGEEYRLGAEGTELAEVPAAQGLAIPAVSQEQKKQLLLTIFHLEKKLSDLKQDLLLAENDLDGELLEKVAKEIEERIATLDHICPHKY